MGFLFAGALAGLATVAWPLYLHFFQRPKPRTQVVPSLRIFGVEIKRRRRRTVEELLLLLCRALVLVALAALLAQPFLESEKLLPLPLLEPEPLLLGVIFDDSLPSCAATANESRLDLQKQWLTDRIGELPEDAGVVVVTTSVPTAGPPLAKDAAEELIAEIESVPAEGAPVAAIRGLLKAVSGRKCALCFVGSRAAAQWPAERRDDVELDPLFFRDVSDCYPECIIEKVEPGAAADAPGRWACRLRGEAERLIGKTVSVTGPDGPVATVTLTPVEAFRHRVDVDLSADAEGSVFTARLDAGYEHAWFTYHFQAGREAARQADDVLVIHGSTPGAILAKKILSAAVNAADRSVALRYLQTGNEMIPTELGAESAVLLAVGTPDMPLVAALQGHVGAGGNLVILPPETGAGTDGTGFLPAWGPVETVAPAALAPLRVGEAARRTGELDGLVLSGLLGLTPSVVRSPQLEDGWDTVLQAANGLPLLCRRRYATDGVIWALAAPLTLTDDSIAMHPLFPHLITTILDASDSGSAAAREVFVGEQVTLQELFGRDALSGTLITPSGQTTEIVLAGETAERLYLDGPGVYALGDRGKRRVAPVNYPRLPDDAVVPRDEWVSRFPNIEVQWMDADDPLPEDPFRVLDAPDGDRLRQYDVSPVCAGLLALAFLGEGILYVTAAIRRKREYA